MLGPNVTVSAGVVIGGGVRIRESIILEDATIQEHCCVLYSIVGWNTILGAYVRIEGTRRRPACGFPHIFLFARIDVEE